MFGFSFGELVVLVIVGVVVIGPKELPKVLRKLGQWSGKLRRMASEIRVQSGIDEVLRGEGIAEDIAEIRKLARGEMDNVRQATRIDFTSPTAPPIPARNDPYAEPTDALMVVREREYPREGADSLKALPDTAVVYASTLPVSSLARDPLYMTGDPNGVIPTRTDGHADAPSEPTGAPSGHGSEAH